ncbi:MAG: NADH-quinone oxidoreductase subunit N [Psychrobacter glaciei]|jgi:NADH-quinone oxidoreductase subunit N|uniref:NADH-quinone oxidoreductase subunit N n=1 Tax=Psychrobacter glaciei TaxID=619771 RepID=A0ABQ3GT55_9GAMM|nr:MULTISPECIES: NADH-quinone oxidoreductase subunit N [Psychrobacter]MBF4489776.1 NADH-quinone oxidoreductase subunit N [Psychrobacter sp. N25K4-3-2]MBP3946820.1 NADH-quinone oxidoreductase subunit N [Psychrobacter sp. K31L]MCH1783808.1 NADH-quinone oxidoreductase subunit N [Psychrobacter glaciei]GHD37062.1 NADH-quinone oxidoreductase subunit N [Psychrobacter glaciei]
MNEFTMNDLMGLMPYAPIIAVVITVLLVMIAITIKRSHIVTGTITVVGLNIALFTLIGQMAGIITSGSELPIAEQLFVIDNFAQFNMVVILICALACCTLSYAYLADFKDNKDELYLLMLLSTTGALLMVCAQHMASFFMSLELLSVPLYGLLSYTYMRNRSLESGLKYLVLSATASATLLMGMAFIYAQVGSLAFKPISIMLVDVFESPLLILGAAMMMFGIAFKLSAAPFHMWTPDVYEGAPAPIATFLASVSKVAMMALAVRFLIDTSLLALPSVQMLLMVMATLSILAGNLLAVRQTSLKRLLGYSSIAHMGYVLIVIVSIGSAADSISSMYMAVYAFTSIGAFGVVTLMSSPYRLAGEADELTHYQGLFWRRPVLTAVMTIMMLSLAGIPLTAGFITKLFAILAAVQGANWFLAAMIILGSAIGLFYYLRVLLTLFKRPKQFIEFDVSGQWGIRTGGIMVIAVTAMIVFFGILPNTLIEWASLARIW